MLKPLSARLFEERRPLAARKVMGDHKPGLYLLVVTVMVGTRRTRVMATFVRRAGDAVGTSVRAGVMPLAIVRPRGRVMTTRMA
jgi:hypothetical protein